MAAPFEQQVVFLPVSDLDRSTEFYTGALEMELVLEPLCIDEDGNQVVTYAFAPAADSQQGDQS